MEASRHDINELLTRGFFTTTRGKSPAPPQRAPRSYRDSDYAPRHERRTSGVSRQRGPRPTVEDEVVSLARESSATSTPPSYEPPFRGPIDQVPIILDVDESPGAVASLHSEAAERRFVLLPRSGNRSSSESEDDVRKRKVDRRKDRGRSEALKDEILGTTENDTPQPSLQRRRSRQDLPALQTKLPRELPPQYRRSVSETPKPQTPTPRPAGEAFLSPDVPRGKGDFFSSSAPRYQSESFGGRATPTGSDRRSGSRPGTPSFEKRHSGGFDAHSRSRRNTNDKLTRPQQLAEGYEPRRSGAHSPGNFDRPTSSPRYSRHSSRRYSSSSDDIADSDSDQDQAYSNRGSQGSRRHRPPYPDDDYDHPRSPSRSNIYPSHKEAHSRHASPLASPKVSPSQMPRADILERSETFPRDKRNSPKPPASPSQEIAQPDRLRPMDGSSRARSRSRSNANATQVEHEPRSSATLPVPIPSRIDIHAPGEHRDTPPYPLDLPSPVAPPRSPIPCWQPPSFQPPSNLEAPVGSYRRYSEDIEKGSVPALLPCPRTSYTSGQSDWLTLPNYPSFDICPSCFNSTIAPTEFGDLFVPSPPRSSNVEVICGFGSSPWYRIAWLLTLKKRRRDLKLFYGLANICANEQPCAGKQEVTRRWQSVIDPKTDSTVRNFNVCDHCVKSVEVLLPSIRGIFVRKDSHGSSGCTRICDFRFESRRFVQYFDTLEVTADRADQHDTDPDARRFASLARRLASMDECARDKDLADRKWHVITQLPEFTVCEECFDEVVWPELDEKKSIPMLFNKPLRLPRASCQLYSLKMRGVFRTAVDADDYRLLASKARERKTIEVAYKANVAELKRQERYNPAIKKELKRVEEEWRRWE